MKAITLILALSLSACSHASYWVHAPEKDDAQMLSDSKVCLKHDYEDKGVYTTPRGVVLQDNGIYYLNCMTAQGHQLKE